MSEGEGVAKDEARAEAVLEGVGGGRAVGGEIEIAASPEAVWRALTDAAELERWFPLEARVEPGPEGSIWMSWQNEFAGSSRILEWDPPRRLVTSWGWPEDQDEQQGQVTEYTIEARGGRTLLRVVTSGFPDDSSWDEWVEGTRLGWRFELRSLRQYLEDHAGERRVVVYLRRRIDEPRVTSWPRLLAAVSGEVEGEVFDDEPGRERAWLTDRPVRGIARVSIEGTPSAPERSDVVLWLSAWGDHADAVPAVEGRWRRLLETTFPEGETV